MRLLVLLSITALFLGSNAKQFEHWYPFYRWTLTGEGNAPTCLKNYAREVDKFGPQHSMTCKTLVSCIYSNTKEIDKADMSSALVLLGLTPTVLGQIGPTIHNKAQLCFHYPVLGLLCVLGAPAMAFGMPWAKTDPREPPQGNAFASGEKWIVGSTEKPAQPVPTLTRLLQYLIRLLIYLIAAGAAINVFLNAWTLGQQTVVSWKCTSSYLELVWVVTTLAPMLFAITAYSMEGSKRTSEKKGWALWIRSFYSLSNVAGAGHVIFGTLVFSSVLFIGTRDALGVVGRLTGSALVCQFITALELERVEEESERKRKRNEESEKEMKRKEELEKGESIAPKGMQCGSCLARGDSIAGGLQAQGD
ncbi:hypothetical protein N7491_004476 [Penicillium cf. griseofulvum]|uniref:Uncharacterized protein n=1 Tax=Penicillium cf. griseofulvum TaxID=2972120 RepID=A0A9W9J2P1_9EURO|nr:hypothetical protein N7472_007165 [Penicillium cf. griseofulvum]KAJ5422902.1 hypothetical protein N7445_011010 [Penicillium cf. griseofulvum]KAJ5433881.1 hypothetical protein N7491_004476 [Penicillium cf. griseofulvum]